ncbi:hypothetical protein SAMN05216274_11718 [Cryobacterium levicorallinum]|uniref:Uncharacterized protein n=1 Tax=Cryobacterium levicorallinum TaxID=995038 RepID=A0ABY1EH33_9MICO|nr:hypothetical protein SAMN05216274_11718 [Cryobacterium levicorallinum]
MYTPSSDRSAGHPGHVYRISTRRAGVCRICPGMIRTSKLLVRADSSISVTVPAWAAAATKMNHLVNAASGLAVHRCGSPVITESAARPVLTMLSEQRYAAPTSIGLCRCFASPSLPRLLLLASRTWGSARLSARGCRHVRPRRCGGPPGPTLWSAERGVFRSYTASDSRRFDGAECVKVSLQLRAGLADLCQNSVHSF